MKIKINKNDFIKALQIGGAFAGNNKINAMLFNVKIKVAGDKLTVVSTDNENAISKRINVIDSDSDVTFCVDPKDLMAYIKLIHEDSVEIIINDKVAEIKHAKGSFTLPVDDDADFPTIKSDEESIDLTMSASLLNNWIIDGRLFVASDELRPIMNCIYIYGKEGELGCCATDGHAMFMDSVYDGNTTEFSFVINKNAFSPICNAIANVEEVKIKVGGKNVMFVADGVSIIARQVEGRFPNFKSVVPKDNNIEIKVVRKDMLNALTRCTVGVNKSSMLTKVNVDGFNMEISGNDIDYNKKTVEYLPVESDGNIAIGFNYSFLMKTLNAVTTENVVMKMKDSSRASIFKEDNDDSGKLIVLMPMML